MMLYHCNICTVFEYEPERGNSLTGIQPGTLPADFPDTWKCPICTSDKTHLVPVRDTQQGGHAGSLPIKPVAAVQGAGYLSEWERPADSLEIHMKEIHRMAVSGESISEPMRTTHPVISWDDILIKGAQIARIPLNHDVPVLTRTVIGPGAQHPLVIETPLLVTHMSFGALSREAKIALAQGSAAARTAIGSGEGGMLEDERRLAYRYILEYVPNRYSITQENLRSVDAIEIKLGQSAEPGLGARLPAEKVTPEIARIRGFLEGTDIISPASYDDIRNHEDLKKKVAWLRDVSLGKPVGIKLAAGDIEEDLAAILHAGPDFITIDGRPGASGTAPKYAKDASSVPTIFALHRARTYLDLQGARDISLIITGGLRVSADCAKALALGADAIALGTAALMACGCQQYRLCHTGRCPTGITTQDPALRSRLNPGISAKLLENFLGVSTEELRDFARMCGYRNVHELSLENICTTNSEISNHTAIRHV